MSAAPLAATLVALVAFVFCVFASTLLKWHPDVTGPLTAACAVALIASGVWLNRAAGRGGEDEEGPE